MTWSNMCSLERPILYRDIRQRRAPRQRDYARVVELPHYTNWPVYSVLTPPVCVCPVVTRAAGPGHVLTNVTLHCTDLTNLSSYPQLLFRHCFQTLLNEAFLGERQ